MDVLFVIGLPRSGTSLVHNLINDRTSRKAPTFKDFGLSLRDVPNKVFSYHRTLKDENSLAEDQDFNGTLRSYHRWLSSRGDHWVCKSPDHINQIPELIEVFPEARFLWCIRDSAYTMESVKDYFMATGLRWPYSPTKACWDALRILETRESFDYIDVESIPEWESSREPTRTFTTLELKECFTKLRGIGKRVFSHEFEERYSS